MIVSHYHLFQGQQKHNLDWPFNTYHESKEEVCKFSHSKICSNQQISIFSRQIVSAAFMLFDRGGAVKIPYNTLSNCIVIQHRL